LRRALDKHGVRPLFEPYVAKIEHDYLEMESTLLSAGMSGLNLAVVFHEVERGVRALHTSIVNEVPTEETSKQARDLMQLLDGLPHCCAAIQRNDIAQGSSLTPHAAQCSSFTPHRVALTCPLLDSKKDGFEARFAFGLVLGALNNLIDNALYWLRVRWPESANSERKLYLGISEDLEPGPAIVVADNGPGLVVTTRKAGTSVLYAQTYRNGTRTVLR